MPLKQSFCYPCFLEKDAPVAPLFAKARNIGFDAMELWFRDDTFEELVQSAHNAGLKVASMCGHRSIASGMNNPAEHDRIIAELRESIDIAARLNIPGLITFSGNRIEGMSEEQAIANCVACLERIAPYAEEKGINLNMELLNSKVNHPGYQADSTRFGAEICRRVNSPRVKLLYDIYHMQIMEGDVIRTIQENIQWIGHFHTAGNPGRNEMDDQQELNYRGICHAIRQTGYDGYLAHELIPRGDKIQALEAAYNICSEDGFVR